MSETDSKGFKDRARRYLCAEMSADELRVFEDDFFADDNLFLEVERLENEIVDRYAANELAPEERSAFERGLEKFPARREKLANAVALQAFIAEENRSTVVVRPEKAAPYFWDKALAFFRFKSPLYATALTGLALALVFGNVFLLVNNRRQSAEIARLQSARNDVETESETAQQSEIARRREIELQSEIDRERETAAALTDELEREKQNRLLIERQIKQSGEDKTPSPTVQSPLIASIFLLPNAARRGDKSSEPLVFPLERAAGKVIIRLRLPDESNRRERFSIELNGETIARNLLLRQTGDGQKIFQAIVSRANLIDGLNKISVFGESEREIVRYVFNVRTK